MRTTAWVVWIACSSVFLCGASTAADALRPLEIMVDCDEGRDLQRALIAVKRLVASRVPEPPVVFNIVGTCTGNFEIPRFRDVTLKGESPDSSIIQGAVDENGAPVGRTVDASHTFLAIENLTLRNGHPSIVFLHHATALLQNTTLAGATFDNVVVSTAADLTAIDSVFESAGQFGVAVSPGGSFLALFSMFRDNGGAGVNVGGPSLAYLFGGEVTGNASTGVQAWQGAQLTVYGTNLRDNGTTEARVLLDSSLHLTANALVEGDIELERNGFALVNASATIVGELSCDSSSDAWCQTAAKVGSVMGCDSCPAPAANPGQQDPFPLDALPLGGLPERARRRIAEALEERRVQVP